MGDSHDGEEEEDCDTLDFCGAVVRKIQYCWSLRAHFRKFIAFQNGGPERSGLAAQTAT